ncbi:MAG TPA: DUF481 domain-containing protein, partial [Vicinamibacterales bacterium]|nr:DUF481 domain-containing protein [Vicinamibacterales bacterium]
PAQQKPNYGQWWLMNARDVSPAPPGWLFHIEGTASFANQTGSVSGFEYTTNVLSALRKGIFTNQIGGSFILQEARVEGQGNFKQETARAFDMLYINIVKPINLVTALIIEKDEPKRILHREAIFQGVQKVFNFPKGRMLSFSVAAGYEQETAQGQFGDVEEGGPAAYAQSLASLPIGQRGIFTNFVEYFHDLELSDDYRFNWNTSLQLQVNSHIAIGPSFQLRYDAKPVTQVQKTDTMAVIGVTFK